MLVSGIPIGIVIHRLEHRIRMLELQLEIEADKLRTELIRTRADLELNARFPRRSTPVR